MCTDDSGDILEPQLDSLLGALFPQVHEINVQDSVGYCIATMYLSVLTFCHVYDVIQIFILNFPLCREFVLNLVQWI